MLADNLLFLRNIKGLTQEQVAEVIGISRQSYSKWEQGETYPDIDKCDKLAKYYGVTIDSLVHQDNKVDDIKIAPAPIGKHLWGTVTIGSKGQIVIPKAARETYLYVSLNAQIRNITLLHSSSTSNNNYPQYKAQPPDYAPIHGLLSLLS
ncbi:helix-turn-helix domain-containing protein [Roseburia inulinivorans]|uniref:helix-turn-helix domain-containing protein n=1 Tax=Roseburia inulinivorans TaxID=360807 RepID=UPI0025B503AC